MVDFYIIAIISNPSPKEIWVRLFCCIMEQI